MSEKGSIFYRLAVSVLKSTQNLDISLRSSVGTAKKCTKKHDARTKLLFWLLNLAFLTSPSSDLKVPSKGKIWSYFFMLQIIRAAI